MLIYYLKKIARWFRWVGVRECWISYIRNLLSYFSFWDYRTAYSDIWSDRWKEFYIANRTLIHEKLKTLKKGLDEESQLVLNSIFERYVYILPWPKYNRYSVFNHQQLLLDSERKALKEINSYKRKELIKWKLPLEHFEVSVFFYKCGLVYIPDSVLRKLEGADFIDGGAFIGDSALVFQELKPRRVYAIEPSKGNYKNLQKTIMMNGMESSIKPVLIALGECESEVELFEDSSVSTLITRDGFKNVSITQVVAMDKYCRENGITPGLIKLDIEGYELAAIKGAKSIIMENTPVLLISIYHTPEDFFDIKPLLSSWVPEYKFLIRKLNPEHLTHETMLLAYVEL